MSKVKKLTGYKHEYFISDDGDIFSKASGSMKKLKPSLRGKKRNQYLFVREAGDDVEWKEPEYLTTEWNEYLHRRQLALGAWREVRHAILRNIEEAK